MASDTEAFLSDWNEKFPGVDPPNVKFGNLEEAEKNLAKCKALIRNLEEKLNQEKFHLIFLQTYLASKKRAYIGDKFGYTRSMSSSVGSEQDEQAPVANEVASHDLAPETTNTPHEQSNGQKDDNTSQENHVLTNPAQPFPVAKPLARMRQAGSDEKTSQNRLSKVLENVKMFEAQATRETKEQPTANSSFETTSTFPPRSSLRGKRSSYLQVWECQTGADKEQNVEKPANTKFTVKNDNQTPVDGELDAAALAMVGGGGGGKNKSHPEASQRRKDYVEVWTCNTGSQMSMDMYQDEHDDCSQSSPSLTLLTEDEENIQDYDLNDIDMTDGYGKRHYTMAGSDVKLRSNSSGRADQMTNRMTWPASAHGFENNEGNMDGDLDHADMGSIDLSDLENEHSTDSQHSEGSRHDSLDSFPDHNQNVSEGKSFPEISPLHNLRRARTTNERMSVAYSAYSGWSDDDRLIADRTSMLSIQSTEFSDEDRESNEGTLDHLEVTDANMKTELGSTGSPVFARPKQDENEQTATENHESPAVVVTAAPDESHDSPKNEAVSDMVDYQKVRSIAEAEKLRMRRWVLSSVLDNEEAYLQYLNTLLLYMKPLKATIGTSQPVMSAQDFDAVFFRVPELHDLHATFYQKLKPKLDVWSADTTVGDQFKKLLSKLNLYGDYLNNYKRAQHTVEKCAKENEQFAKIIESMKVQSRGSKDSESVSLIKVLYKPVERVMRTTLVLQDLLKHTPHRHPDYHVLRQVLKQAQGFLERINSTSSSSYKPRRVPSSAAAAARSADRELVKDGFLVEVASDGSRKLRHCFLYNDLLLCTKQKSTAGVFHNKDSYECKWYIPLADLSFHPKEDSDAIPDVPATSEDELREMSNRAQQTKREIARERKRNKKEQRGSPVRSRQEERLRKKLAEQEGRIILAAPDLPLRIYHMQGKSYMLLMSSDYERVEWTEAIMKQQETCFKSFSLTSLEVNALLSACVRLRKMNNVGSMLIKDDEDLLCGYLNVTIHSGQGFLRACNPYCTLEVDSFGQFQTKAKTRPCRDTNLPVWDEEFEIDLDGAQTLRILCYDRARDASAGAGYDDDVLIAKGKVGLIQESLRARGEWKEECVLMNEISIRVSVKFMPREHSLQRLPSKKANGTFGVKIDVVAKRESSGIPGIVKKCVAEVERRGMNEVGIYRVSGVASEIQALKASFDTNRKDVTMLLGEVDINAVAGVLKLYFRELPEPLFTDSRYNEFVEASALKDPETKDRTIVRLISDLPTANYKTLHYLREHLVNVSNNESVNKMNLHNLATVFGPTLLRPAEEKAVPFMSPTAGMLNALRLDVHYQMDVLLYCLEMNDLPTYEAMKSGPVADIKRPLSQSSENLTQQSSDSSPTHPQDKTKPKDSRSSLSRSATVDVIGAPSAISAKTVVPAPSSVQRYHPYEEITIGQFKSSVKPPVSRKPSAGPKPKPAPRRSSLMKPTQPVVTDL
uniref:Active breakpoint cluster region-related protein n=1 Tax=Phallusia mammillata TaxID=59560 RepID=A0A6F9D5E1_9ASCI|nr:active breakpoint cluster region-related protein [Phallusia mammillata]